MGGGHHVRLVKELDNRLNGQIRAGRWQSEEHLRLGHPELLPLGAPGQGVWSLEAGAKYGAAWTPLPFLPAGGCDEEDADVGTGDEVADVRERDFVLVPEVEAIR